MKYLYFDTNICIYIVNKRPLKVLNQFSTLEAGDITVSSITVAELQYGVQKSSDPVRNTRALEQFLLPLQILPFDAVASMAYGQLRAELERKGIPIGSMDTLIAAHALSVGVTLVTNNSREFKRVPQLRVENWA